MSFTSCNLVGVPRRDKSSLMARDRAGPTAWEIHSSQIVSGSTQLSQHSQVFGNDPPDWMWRPMEYVARALYAVRYDDAFFSPEWGIVFPKSAVFLDDSANAARYKSPDLSQVYGFYDGEKSPCFSINRGDGNYFTGTFLVLNHWGSKNFGHFIFDSLLGVFIFLSEIMRGELKILTPPLREWQKVFLNRMGISDSAIQEVNAETCRCERVIFPGSLCDNLNFPSPITRAMLDYMKLSGEGQSKINAPRRIYVSRKKYDNRQMLNESELISALNNLGFINICPEDYSIDQQIEIFSGSEIIVGEIGAALSNIAFTDRSCHVIEIIPELKPSVWIKNLCSLLNLKWTSVYCKVPEEFRTVSVVDGIEYNNLIFSYNVSVDDVISAVKSSILDMT